MSTSSPSTEQSLASFPHSRLHIALLPLLNESSPCLTAPEKTCQKILAPTDGWGHSQSSEKLFRQENDTGGIFQQPASEATAFHACPAHIRPVSRTSGFSAR